MMAKALELAGQRFGRLVAVQPVEKRINNQVIWECKCDCGKSSFVRATYLRSGTTQSCGCISKEKAREQYKRNAILGNERNCVENTDLRKLHNKNQKNNTSGRKGVVWDKNKQKWQAKIWFAKKRYHLGYFDDFDKAVQAREEAEEKYFAPMLEKYRRAEE
jgi:hypothetical protein